MVQFNMYVVKRNGENETVSFDKVLNRIRLLSNGLDVNVFEVAQKVCTRIFDGVKTSELDELAAHMCSSMITEHPDYGTLAARIIVSNHHKNTSPSFTETVALLYNNVDAQGEHNPLVSSELYDTVIKNKEKLNSFLVYDRDFLFDYFGFKTLEKSYLMRINGVVIERPQHMWMRVALGIHGNDVKDALETYDLMSKKYFTHATPTLFNSGTPRPQLSSCFLLHMQDDSISGIFRTLEDCALISKYAGGIGLHIHNVRAKGSRIRGTNGVSDGIVPMLRVYNNCARYVNQCITPDKMVFSKAGIKRMDEVTPDDYLITHDGSFKKVNTIVINEKKDETLMVIDVRHSTQVLKCTQVHEILTIDGVNKKNGFRDIKRKLDNGKITPKYIPASDVTTNHLMVYPIPTYEMDVATLTDDDLRLYGIMIGDGSINVRGQWSVNINTTSKVATGVFTKTYLEQRNIHYWEYVNEAVHYITWTQTPKIPFTYSDLYDKDKEKNINSTFLHLPERKLTKLLKGLMETDGYSTKTGVYYGSTSLNVIQSMKYMLLRLGILTTTQIRDKVGQVSNVCNGRQVKHTKINYDIRIPKIQLLKDLDIFTRFQPSKHVLYYQYKNWLLSKVTKVSQVTYTGKVYDFNMMDNHNYLTDSGLVHNSGRRNGSIAMYLEPWHADIQAFLEMKKNHGSEEERARDLFYALWIPDLFMERVKEGKVWSLMCPDACQGLSDVHSDDFKRLYERYEAEGKFKKQLPAQELWWQILQMQIEQGVPYLLFKDAANRKSNQQNLGTIKSSNLCVAGDTMILTDNGYVPIKDLVDSSVKVWNGKQFSDTVVRQTGRMQKLITVKFSNGMEVRCTPYHKFYIETGKRPADKSKPTVIQAQDLKLGMKIIRYSTPCLNTSQEDMKYAYTHGLFCAEGTYIKYAEYEKHQCNFKKWNNTQFCKRHQCFEKVYEDEDKCCAQSYCDKPLLWLYGEKRKLAKCVDYLYANDDTTCDRLNIALPHDIDEKYFVPMHKSISSKVAWLSGYFDGDGCVVACNGIKNIQVSSINQAFIRQVMYLLQTLGVNPCISVLRSETKRLLPDGKGGLKQYTTQTCYRLNIDAQSVINLCSLGLKTHRLDLSNLKPPHHMTNKFTTITGLEDKDEYEDTYCFNEPLEHKGVFNGVIMGQCSEILEFTSPDEIAVCNLSSIALPSYIEYDENNKPHYNFQKLHDVAKVITKNLNKVIDVNFYPVEKARRSNFRHRPIGIGVQGLADTYVMMRYPFDSPEAMKLNRDIFETIYHGAMESSMELSKKRGHLITDYNDNKLTFDELMGKLSFNEYELPNPKFPGAYKTFEGSPASKGQFQFDLWGVQPSSGLWDWETLKADVMTHGIRNSLLLAPMPTASTSQILAFNEAFEPFTSNLYKRKTLAGEFIIVNKYLIKDLVKLGLWDKDMKNKVIMHDGSIQNIEEIPQELKALYKTAWELKQKVLIDQSADRGAFVCQSQSLNLFMEDPDFKKLSSMHFYSWQRGLKTGIYYLRTRAKAQAQKFTIDPTLQKFTNLKLDKKETSISSELQQEQECTFCSS